MKNRMCWVLLLAGLCLASYAAAETPTVLAIRNAKIVTVSGPVIAKGTVVVRNGLIESVGDSVQVPADAWVIDGEGLTVYPGLIDGLNTLGLPDSAPFETGGGARRGGIPLPDFPATPARPAVPQPAAPPARGPEDRPSNTSYVLAADQLSLNDRRIETARNSGFTGSISFPNRNIFSGQGAVINLAGHRPGDMVVQSPAGMFMTLRSGGFGAGFPNSIMGVIAYIRQIFLDAEQYKAAKQVYSKNPLGNKRPEYDKYLEGVLAAPRFLLPANNSKEISRLLHFAQELKMQPVLYGLNEGFRSADILKKYNAKVLVNLRWPEPSRDADPETQDALRVLEVRDKAPSTPAELAKAGIKFGFYAGALQQPSDVGRAVRKAIDAGLSPADAVRAMTLSVAEIFGVSDRVGSIDKGKIANLVVTRGDLFQTSTEIKYVLVDGVKYEPVPEAPAPNAEATR